MKLSSTRARYAYESSWCLPNEMMFDECENLNACTLARLHGTAGRARLTDTLFISNRISRHFSASRDVGRGCEAGKLAAQIKSRASSNGPNDETSLREKGWAVSTIW